MNGATDQIEREEAEKKGQRYNVARCMRNPGDNGVCAAVHWLERSEITKNTYIENSIGMVHQSNAEQKLPFEEFGRFFRKGDL